MESTKDCTVSDNDGAGVSVVIPMLNEEDVLPDLLLALVAQTCPPDEVIFIDAGSVDGGPKKVLEWIQTDAGRSMRGRLISRNGAYPGAARNSGIQAAAYTNIAFLDCGILPEPGWIEALVECRNSTGEPAVFGLCRSKPPRSLISRIVCKLSYGTRKWWTVLPASMVRRSLFADLGGFREDLRSAEDIEWCNRYEAKIGRRRACPGALVRYENFPPSLFSAAKKWFFYARNTVRAGVQPWHQIFLLGIWTLMVLLAVMEPAKAGLLFGVYMIFRGLILPALRSGATTVFQGPLEIPMMLTIGLVLDLAKLAGYLIEYLSGAVKMAISRIRNAKS